jgi:hypothetical protein
LFYILLRPNKNVDVCLSMEVKGREYTGKGSYEPLYMCRKDGYVVFHQSELLCGIMDKKTLGGGSKENIFHVLMRDYSTIVAADRMSRLAKFCARWLAYKYLHSFHSAHTHHTRAKTHISFRVYTGTGDSRSAFPTSCPQTS